MHLALSNIEPRTRLVAVVLVTSALVLPKTLFSSLCCVVLASALLFMDRPVRWPGLLAILILTNSFFIVAGNILFSPNESAGISVWILRINQSGLYNGVVGALKRSAMLIVAFTWLSTWRRLDQLEDALMFSRDPRWRKSVLLFLRELENITQDARNHYSSLVVRGVQRKSFNPRLKAYQAYLMLNSTVMRFFNHVTALSIAAESHFGRPHQQLRVDVVLDALRVRLDPNGPDVLRGIGLTITAGEVVVIFGPNESGKSTLLRSIAGIVPWLLGEFSGGTARLGDRSITEMSGLAEISQFARYVGPSSRDSIVGLTVGAEMMTLTSDAGRATEWLGRLGIDQLWDAPTGTLSGGQQMRLVLAGALCSGARCLLFDSPLAELDEECRISFISAVKSVMFDPGVTVIIAAETFEPYVEIAKRFIYLQHGQVADEIRGTFLAPEDVYRALGQPRPEPISTGPRPAPPRGQGRPLIALDRVSVERGGNLVIRDVDMCVRAGDCLTLTGPNGGGKTTVALTLAGALRPTRGERISHGVRVGLAFQRPEDFILEVDCGKEILVTPLLLGWGAAARADCLSASIARLSLPANARTLSLHPVRAKMLSCVAAMSAAAVAIFDEPSAEMDAAGVEWFTEFVNVLLDRNCGVVVITHDDRLLGLASRALRVQDGRVVDVSR